MSLVGLSTSASALACGGDWFPEVQVDPRIHGLREAEKSLNRGDYVAAAGSVVRMMPHIKKSMTANAKICEADTHRAS